jgi:putative acetyltransferase
MARDKTKEQMELNIIIEDANQDDIAEIQQLFFETINMICKKDYTKEQIEAWSSAKDDDEKWLNKILNQYFLVARSNNKIVGFGSLQDNSYLDLLYVHKDYQKKDIAKRILLFLEKKAEINQAEMINADVSKTAKSFFEKNGYKIIKEQKKKIKNVSLPNFKMVKKLSFIR